MKVLLYLTTFLGLAACAPVLAGPEAPLAASENRAPPGDLDGRLIRARTDPGLAAHAQDIVISNGSAYSIVVTALYLEDCKNIRNVCGMKRLNLEIGPFSERRIETVRYNETAEERGSFRFRFKYEVKGASGG